MVDHVSGGEYALEVGTGRAWLDEDVALGVEVDLASHQFTARLVPDRDEQALGSPALLLAGFDVAQDHAR